MCDSIVVVGAHTASGRTLFAKNSDRHASECQPVVAGSARHHAPGSRLDCTHIAIEQVAHTHAVLGHSPHWVWGFEHGVNEHGVAIGNHTIFSREPVEETPGLIGMDLVRLGLERATRGSEALRVISELVEQHGQGGAAFGPGEAGYHNSFTIADPGEAWQLETSGRRWAARPVERGALGNQFCIDDRWTLGSEDLESFARASGWAPTQGARSRLHVERAYRHPQMPGRISEPRLRRTRGWLEETAAAQPEHAMSLLRDHGGEARPMPLAASLESEERFTVCMHAEPVGTTTASMVALLPEASGPSVWPVWLSFGSPCVGVFLPVYVGVALPPALCSADPPDAAWWTFHRLSGAAEYCGVSPSELRDRWRPFELEREEERLRVEAYANEASAAGDVESAHERLRGFVAKSWQRAMAFADEATSALS